LISVASPPYPLHLPSLPAPPPQAASHISPEELKKMLAYRTAQEEAIECIVRKMGVPTFTVVYEQAPS
jgi:hypothetical protein